VIVPPVQSPAAASVASGVVRRARVRSVRRDFFIAFVAYII
jgi:hypothetical protein